MGQSIFLNSLRQGVFTTFQLYEILPSVTAAQAILESNWGKSRLARECCNLFGIKADRGWKRQKQAYSTKEYDNQGNLYTVVDYFRKYDSYEESLHDHGKFFHENKRYAEVIGITNYKKQAQMIQRAGYATDPEYANKLIRLIEQNELQNWDDDVLFSSNQQDDQITHTVKNGDTVSEIARKYGLSTQTIVKSNHLNNPDLIYPEQLLLIPAADKQSKGRVYTVKKGDTLSSIAERFNTSIQKLAEDNKISDMNLIQIGQKLFITP